MTARGGPTQEIDFDGDTFICGGEADPDVAAGGGENDIIPNGDNKTARWIHKTGLWGYIGLEIQLDQDSDDRSRLNAVKLRGECSVTITESNGDVFMGTGGISGEPSIKPSGASATIDVMGPGVLKKQ